MINVKTKIRPAQEIYEEYCKITLAYSDIHGEKFINALRVILEDIKARNFKEASSKEFEALNEKVWEVNPVYGKDSDATIRKAINQFSKLGFVEPRLNDYHEDSPKYISSKSDEYRKVLFSFIVTEYSKFSTSYKNYNKPGADNNYIPFITKTLMRAGELNEKQIIGLLTVDPTEFKDGYINLNDLNSKSEIAEREGFFKKKYNQVRFFKQILGRLENFSYSPTQEKLLGFKSDQNKKYKKEIHNKKIPRESVKDLIAYKKVDLENLRIAGNKKICMVQNIEFPTIIHSHIKRSKLSNFEEKYDPKNLLILSSEIDIPFDRGDISFEDNGNIIFANNIKDDFFEKFKNYKLNKAFLDKERKIYLKWNRDNWFNKNPRKYK